MKRKLTTIAAVLTLVALLAASAVPAMAAHGSKSASDLRAGWNALLKRDAGSPVADASDDGNRKQCERH